MFYIVYTCKLQMNASLRIIFVLVLAACFAMTFAQDSTQTPSAPEHSQPTPTALSSDPQVAQPHPSTIQDPTNATNVSQSTANQTSNPDIVINQVEQPTNPPQQQHPLETQVTQEQPQAVEHDQAAENHETEQQFDVDQQTRQHIHKMLSQMSDQQLEAFQQSLEGQALGYYHKIMEEDAQRARQQEVQYQQQYQQIEQELTKTRKEQAKEQDQFQKERNQFNRQMIDYNEYLFELDAETSQDFRLAIPNAQKIIFYGYTYENNEGVYSVTADVEEQDPIWLYIYENNHKIVYQKSFYFKYYGSIQGNQNCSYLLRFVNPTQHKLIAVNIGVLFEVGHVSDKLTADDLSNHSRRIQTFRHEIANQYTDMSMRSMLQNQNRQNLLGRLDRYYLYSIVELVILMVLCVLQVEFVKKLLLNNTNVV